MLHHLVFFISDLIIVILVPCTLCNLETVFLFLFPACFKLYEEQEDSDMYMGAPCSICVSMGMTNSDSVVTE